MYYYWVLADVVNTCLSTFACALFAWKTNSPIRVLLALSILWRCVCPWRVYSNQHRRGLYRQWRRCISDHSKASYLSFDASYWFLLSVDLDKRFKNAQFKNMEFLEIVWGEVFVSCRFFKRPRFAACLCSLFWTISPRSATKPNRRSSTPCSIYVEVKTSSFASSESTAIAPLPSDSKSESKAGLSLFSRSRQILAAADRRELSSSFRGSAVRCLHALSPRSAARNASVEFRREENRAEQGVSWAGEGAIGDLSAFFPYPLCVSACGPWRAGDIKRVLLFVIANLPDNLKDFTIEFWKKSFTFITQQNTIAKNYCLHCSVEEGTWWIDLGVSDLALLIAAKHFVQRKMANYCFLDLLDAYNK